MINRDEYVQKLKQQLDEWNGEAAKWEAKTREAQAAMKAEYEKQIAALNGRREEALYQMKLLQNASADAWRDAMGGAEKAWKDMQEAFERARSHFEKK
jgi:lipid II:glycine glycyltransferase (peptidoglycan interpeptide bridge formation enzyme)